MILDAQFNPAHMTWPEIRDRTLEAQADGFGVVWVVDHLSGQPFGGSRMLECFTLAGALAAATSTIGVGTLVVNVGNRHPALLAVSAASAQEISAGRFHFGLGAGAAPGTRWAVEHEVAGIDLPESASARHQRLFDTLDTCEQMWDPERGDEWHGFPLPEVRPPVWVGVNSEALAVRAAPRVDGVNVRLDHPRHEAILGAARAARERSPRAAEPLSLSVWTRWSPASRDPDGPVQRRLDEFGVDRLILVP